METIKKGVLADTHNQTNYSSKYLTMQLRNMNAPLTRSQIERTIRRSKRIQRWEIIKRAARYTGGFALIAIVWIVMTGV